MITIYVDADGCSVRDETCKVAERYRLKTIFVANKALQIPLDPIFEMKVVTGAFDAADDWIVENSTRESIVITSDILLAQRAIEKGARVLGSKGEEFTEDNIGSAVASRELMQNLRHMGEMRGGPAPMNKQARSQFLNKLDQIIQALLRTEKLRR